MSASQRDKGARGERELAKLLEERLGVAVTRNLMQWRDGGHDLNGIEGIALEVKRHEKLELGRWWDQAMEQAASAPGKCIPALAWRQNGKKWTFRVPVQFFLPMAAREEIRDTQLEKWCHTADTGIDTFCLLVREHWL